MYKPEYDVWFALFTSENPESSRCRLYKRRWFVLLLFVLYIVCGTVHWCQYSTIADVIAKFYKVSSELSEGTETVFLVTFLLLSWLGWNILEQMSFRWTIIAGMTGTCFAYWIKVLSSTPERFWCVYFAQIVAGASQIVMVPAIPKLAATWFGSNEVSTICGIFIASVLFGTTLGFSLPKLYINITQDEQEIKLNLQALNLAMGIASSITLILLLRFLEERPPLTPSAAQMRLWYGKQSEGVIKTLRTILSNRSYQILLFVYSINIASMCALLKVLPQVVVDHYLQAGAYPLSTIFLVTILSGYLGCIASGVLLSLYKNFKTTALATYLVSFVAMICFTIALIEDLTLVHVTAALLGYSMCGTLTIGFELATELTYPEPQVVACGFLVTVSQVFGLIFTPAYTYLLQNVGDTFANLAVSGLLLIGCLLIVFIRPEYKRQAAPIKVIRI